ncbi:hypothetical protein FOG50_02489 [Hanseniaspora uvarum]|uniref:Alpha N-terminal protein methyltransferase 1 n=1 Tax=Hanseniaspora uvarum TaxID=29833 RepID=A0A1E5RIK1_HANUV|nr:hypothetical protein FOG48_00978 [Hanseniaspora uvarum]KAF0276747.1 hypothetical protein FOG50_02489 [Hanseniaspora uvarum]OEJ86731.1 Alpha N-terminal protein methyltransferase 1 [Hanseniaspora uvarum]GMM39518.1 N-terminal protein methyltransferase [Hanseniaspora uvarum]
MADANINYNTAVNYWESTTSDVNGVLGGYGEQTTLPQVEQQGSLKFIKKLKSRMLMNKDEEIMYGRRVMDFGAGIGRVTKNVLYKINEGNPHQQTMRFDLLEPASNFVDQMRIDLQPVNEQGLLGDIYHMGMQDWPHNVQDGSMNNKKYWLIWCQWCLGQVPDNELIYLLERCKKLLVKNGTIVVKENTINSFGLDEQDEFDPQDSSVTRTDNKFRWIFEKAGFNLIACERQKGLPEELFPVRMYALKPRED